jgi:GGDEF domain-containing protein
LRRAHARALRIAHARTGHYGVAMREVAVAFWGGFFCTAFFMFAGGVLAWARSHRRVGFAAIATALLSAMYVATTLHLFGRHDPLLDSRLVGVCAIVTSSLLRLMLLVDLGHLHQQQERQRHLLMAGGVGGAGVLLVLFAEAQQAVLVGHLVTIGIAGWTMLAALRSAREGDRVAWTAVLAIACLAVGLTCLGWIALDTPVAPWPVHLASAAAGIGYLAFIGAMLWLRYSYLIELREVMAHGPRYDPITRMFSHLGTEYIVARSFLRQRRNPEWPLVLVAVSIGNLYALENLHGRAALNHALFVCGGRLRRAAPPDVEAGRLFDDGFLLVARNVRDLDEQIRLGRRLAERLARPVKLQRPALREGEAAGETEWAAQVGVGLLAVPATASRDEAIAMARDLSRTAWSFASRVAWHDSDAGAISEVPELDTLPVPDTVR